MISLYRPGSSWLHRLPVAAKFLALVVALLLISIFAKDGLLVSVAVLAAVIGYFAIGATAREVAAVIWSLKLVMLLVLVPQLVFMGVELAVVNSVRLLACILFAMLFTTTTSNQEIMNFIERLAKPVSRIGIRPETVALLVAMTLNSINLIGKFLADIREAQLARGIKPRAHRMALPLLVKSLKHADDYAEALQARGVQI